MAAAAASWGETKGPEAFSVLPQETDDNGNGEGQEEEQKENKSGQEDEHQFGAFVAMGMTVDYCLGAGFLGIPSTYLKCVIDCLLVLL